MKFSNLELILYALGYALLLGALMAVSYYPPKDGGPALVAWLFTALGTLSGHMLGNAKGKQSASDAVTPIAPPVASGQGGFVAWSMYWLLVPMAFAAALMTGCTTTTASMYSGLYTQAKAGVHVFDDNTLSTMRDLVCAQPYSAIQRHPELQPGIVALCGPLVNTASLDPAQVASMLSIAKQLGLTAAPAAK